MPLARHADAVGDPKGVRDGRGLAEDVSHSPERG